VSFLSLEQTYRNYIDTLSTLLHVAEFSLTHTDAHTHIQTHVLYAVCMWGRDISSAENVTTQQIVLVFMTTLCLTLV